MVICHFENVTAKRSTFCRVDYKWVETNRRRQLLWAFASRAIEPLFHRPKRLELRKLFSFFFLNFNVNNVVQLNGNHGWSMIVNRDDKYVNIVA